MEVLEVTNLSKAYHSRTALESVSFKLQSGRIYGFIGNNGAGKTTLMRIVCGLARPSAGSYSVFGASSEKERLKVRHRIGVLIEAPIFYPELTARQNLYAQSILKKDSTRKQADELLKAVGLDGEQNRRVRDFSTGMKQRYGLAAALLGDPELLLLDEPLNGLDVQGMDEVSDIITSMRREKGVTVLLSSHLLARLHGVATDYIFIDRGRIAEQITAEELNAKAVSKGDLEDYFRELVRPKGYQMKRVD